MSTEESAAAYAATRRGSRQGAGPSPVGSTLSLVLALVAVVAGFLILRNLTAGGGSSTIAGPEAAVAGDASETTLPDLVNLTGVTTTTTTTTVPLVTTGASVVVANANGVDGSAGAMTRTLEIFDMTDPVNATGPTLGESIIYFDPDLAGAQDVANSVASVMGGLLVEEVPTPVPTESGSLNGSGVLVMLGTNQVGKTLEQMQDEVNTAVIDAPEVSGTVPVAISDE